MSGWQQAFLWPFAVDVVRLSLWMAILAVIFVPLERLFAARRQRIFRTGFLEDSVYFFLNGLIIKSVLIAVLAAVAAVLYRIVPGIVQSAAGSLPLWLRVAAALVVGDIGFYWGHRWMHEIPVCGGFTRSTIAPRRSTGWSTRARIRWTCSLPASADSCRSMPGSCPTHGTGLDWARCSSF